MKVLRLALAQINPTVGDLPGNSDKIIGFITRARRQKADIAVFPELALTGYPPEDLILKPQFLSDNIAEMRRICGHVTGIAAIVGFVDRGEKNEIYNAAAVIAEKKIVDVYYKMFLPNYGVFDEFRYFQPGKRFPVYILNDIRFGINICEDIWHCNGPARVQAISGAEVIININASPYETGKPQRREKILTERIRETGAAIAYLNTVGGQDELVFDGMSMVYDSRGALIVRAGQFEEEMFIVDVAVGDKGKMPGVRGEKLYVPAGVAGPVETIKLPDIVHEGGRSPLAPVIAPPLGNEEEIYRALVLGTRDYVWKNGFKGVVIGFSGGIDSSLVAAVAVDAIGRENVRGLFMPSRYTTVESREDAFGLAGNLGVETREIPIDAIFGAFLKTLEDHFRGKEQDVTEENLQARIRGNILMAFSNKFGWLVLTTGNKSEMSVGYATLYGDMAGGFAVIKDVPKTMVYDLCHWRNSQEGVKPIPERVLWKEPTAELRPDQRDTDSLPPYQVLDPILKAYIEDELTFEEILKLGCDFECAARVIRMVDRSEYKRRQAPPGIKITARAFGRDRRFPITNRYKSY